MVDFIDSPAIIKAAGTKEKIIEEYFGNVNSGMAGISVARMRSAAGWEEPGQCPDFEEYTVVLNGILHVKTKYEELDIAAGQAILAHKHEWIQYSSPHDGGAEYIAICLPAFTPDSVNRDK
jgi:hypothetical protein